MDSQSVGSSVFEVIIVDNGSTDGTREIAQDWCKSASNRIYIREERLGLAIARNVGLAAASAPAVAYTDDDAVVATDWVKRIIERFSELPGEYAALGGELDPVWEVEPPEWLRGHLVHNLSVSLGWSTTARELVENEWICEANCAYRTDTLRGYGGFPENLGRVGPMLLSGENFVNELMKQDGLRFFFDPEIRASHYISAGRLTKSWMRRRAFWAGVTASRLPRVAAQYGKTFPGWKMVKPPTSVEEWTSLFDDENDDGFEAACAKLTEIGYLLGHTGAIL